MAEIDKVLRLDAGDKGREAFTLNPASAVKVEVVLLHCSRFPPA